MRPRRRVGGRNEGASRVVVAAAVGMALVVTMGAADVGRALIARSRAEAAADLAALAAAQELAFPSGIDPAAFAADYADPERRPARVVLLRRGNVRGGRPRGGPASEGSSCLWPIATSSASLERWSICLT